MGFRPLCTLHDLGTTCPIAFRIRHGSFCLLPAGAASCHDCAPHAELADDPENAEALELFRADFENEMHLARRLIVPSRAHKDAILAHHPDIAGKIRVVRHGAITDLAPHAPRGKSRSGRIRVGHWGNLSKLKGIDLLFEAVASLPEAVRDRLELHVFGPIVYPDERPEIEALAARTNAKMHGPYVPADLESVPLDLAVIPTRCSESHSFVLDEAFQLGLPAIVPRRGALAERIGGAGTTFEPENAADLARRLAEVVETPELLADWRESIPGTRPFPAHVQEVVSVYREVLGSHAPLQVTPPELRRRRARFRSRQVQERARRLWIVESDKRNLEAHVASAEATMREMHHYHLEKDRVIEELRADVKSKSDVLEELRADVQKKTEALEAAENRAGEARESATNLVADLGKARLAVNEAVRKAAVHEHGCTSRPKLCELRRPRSATPSSAGTRRSRSWRPRSKPP